MADKDKYQAIREKYKPGDWVIGIGEHVGCSEVFVSGVVGNEFLEPFSYLSETNPDAFRIATQDEQIEAMTELGYPEVEISLVRNPKPTETLPIEVNDTHGQRQ